AAAGALANDGGPAELLQVVAELLAAGERGRAGEYVDRLCLAEAAAGNIRKRPGLLELAAFPQPAELGRLVVPQVADDECGHGRLAAQAMAQVDDERIGAGQQGHRGDYALPADCDWEQDRLQVEVADVACH